MNVRETYRRLLLGFPSIFPTPLDVSIHLFSCIGNGFEWNVQGELVDVCTRGDYNDPEPPRNAADGREYDRLTATWTLEHDAEVIMREFVKSRIEMVLDAGPVASFFLSERRESYYVSKSICCDYSRAINFPQIITADWAKAVCAFLGWWIVNLRGCYGLGHDVATELDHWPAEIKKAYVLIRDAQVRVWPMAHDGTTYAEYSQRGAGIVEKLFAEVTAS